MEISKNISFFGRNRGNENLKRLRPDQLVPLRSALLTAQHGARVAQVVSVANIVAHVVVRGLTRNLASIHRVFLHLVLLFDWFRKSVLSLLKQVLLLWKALQRICVPLLLD